MHSLFLLILLDSILVSCMANISDPRKMQVDHVGVAGKEAHSTSFHHHNVPNGLDFAHATWTYPIMAFKAQEMLHRMHVTMN